MLTAWAYGTMFNDNMWRPCPYHYFGSLGGTNSNGNPEQRSQENFTQFLSPPHRHCRLNLPSHTTFKQR